MTLIVDHALHMLRADPDYLADARKGAKVDNTVVGSMLAITWQTPRQYAEQAVRDALEILAAERKRP
jgi:hypothetical protein